MNVPAGAALLDVRFDFLSPPKSFGDGYGRTPNVTPHLLVLPFNHVVLYPRDAALDALRIQASVRIPAGWQFDVAVRPSAAADGRIALPEMSLYTLLDSPLLAGEYFRSVPLADAPGATRISIAADAPADLAINPTTVTGIQRLVAEANAHFGTRHYREYVWLIALGDNLDPNGLEHHESTDIRDAQTLFTDPVRLLEATVIPHEYVHSWNGKYRRPDGLATKNDQEPMIDDLLWVYEGMTQYLGDAVLFARSGLGTQEQTRSLIALIAARMENNRPGRAWRSIGDTATALPGFNDAPGAWSGIRRNRDYYSEMLLVWLDADTLIREKSGGTRSLDDFCRAFFGRDPGAILVRPYTRAELVKVLHDVAPIDWDGFLKARVDGINPHAPLDGITRGGWTLTYSDEPNPFIASGEKENEADDLGFSLGFWVKSDAKSAGTVDDVVYGSPAFAAGLAPQMRVIAIDGHKWNIETARDVIVKAEKTREPIELIVESADLVRTLRIDYHGGLRHPHLVRNESVPDLLTKILTPLVPVPAPTPAEGAAPVSIPAH